tara:strand:- start:150 stop:1043 length:894 start_codon:yes stop_codon:yes gene_type:complete
MIYKFIDINGSEISVNSISSLQSLVDSNTIKENTKIKAGLRGKWNIASEIEELSFAKEVVEEIPETIIPETNIKPSIKLEKETDENTSEKKTEETTIQPWQTKKEAMSVEKIEKKPETILEETEVKKPEIVAEEIETEKPKDEEEEKFEYELEEENEEEKRDKTYDDENIVGLNLFDSVITCFKNFFNFRDRASRSEYWYFQLVFTIVSIPLFFYEDSSNDKHLIYSGISGLIVLLLFIPAISVSVRRLHDIDKSGWFVFISVIPFIGWVILAIMLIGKGTEGKNRFGKYPLNLKIK